MGENNFPFWQTLANTSLRSPRASRSVCNDPVDEAAVTDIEVKGVNGVVDRAREAQLPLDVEVIAEELDREIH